MLGRANYPGGKRRRLFCVLLLIFFYFLFIAFDGIDFSLRFLSLLYPIACLIVFNIGVGFILSALYIYFFLLLFLLLIDIHIYIARTRKYNIT